MGRNIWSLVMALALVSCVVGEPETSEDGVVEPNDEATEQDPTEIELKRPVYLGYVYPGPHRTWCNVNEYPTPCPGFQEKWVSCHSGCLCNYRRRGSTNSFPYFKASTTWYRGDVIDCR
jgi:hypothetical protein